MGGQGLQKGEEGLRVVDEGWEGGAGFGCGVGDVGIFGLGFDDCGLAPGCGGVGLVVIVCSLCRGWCWRCGGVHVWQWNERRKILDSAGSTGGDSAKATTLALLVRRCFLHDDCVLLRAEGASEVIDEETCSLVWTVLKQDIAVFHEVVVGFDWLKTLNVGDCLGVLFQVFNENVNDQTMFVVTSGQESCLIVVATLSAHNDGCVEIELQIAWLPDELFQLVDVF